MVEEKENYLMQQYLVSDRGAPLEVEKIGSENTEMLTEDLLKLNFLQDKKVYVHEVGYREEEVQQIADGELI